MFRFPHCNSEVYAWGEGMRGLCRAGVCAVLLATPIAAQGADLVAVPAPVAQAPLWSWTGFYAGVHLASGWANPTWQSGTGLGGFVPFPGGASGNGAVGGGQVGWNYQTGPWVLGVEAAISAADINAVTACAVAAFICSVNVVKSGQQMLGTSFSGFDPKRHCSHSKAPPLLVSDMLVWRVGRVAMRVTRQMT
jgi:opacity protein-like surface antigen